MKTIKILLIATIVTFFAACDKNKDNGNDNQNGGNTNTELTEITFNVMSNVGGDTPYTQENVSVIVEKKGEVIDMKLQKVKFAEKMPAMDITIPGIAISNETLSGDGIIPLTMGGEFPAYTITNLEGTMTKNNLSVSMMCGKYPLQLTGANK